MFSEMFPPSFDPINAGFLSMAENDIVGRVEFICDTIKNDWGTILPSRAIIDNALNKAGIDPWMLPPKAIEMLDFFDIIEE